MELPLDRFTLVVNSEEEHLRFVLIHPTNEWERLGRQRRPDQNRIDDTLAELAGHLSRASSATSRKLLENYILLLRALGARLYSDLIPQMLHERIVGWPNGTWLTVVSDEWWVPWELLCCEDQFFAERFMVFRLPVWDRERVGRHLDASRRTGTAASKKILHIIGGGLTRTSVAACRRHFAKTAHARHLEQQPPAVVIDAIRDAHLVHMTCHGHRAPVRLQVSRSKEEACCLTVTMLSLRTVKVKQGGVIFANACSSAAVQPDLNGFLAFGSEFYFKGAALFIGSLGTVTARAAIKFAQTFYDALRDETPGDLCGAYRLAQERFLASRKDGKDRLIVPLYSLYGNPLQIPRVYL
jgi:hypothetical protein